VSLQADFENLPERMQAALTELTSVEIESLRLLTHSYDDKADFEAVIPLLLSLKGALQYRRVMGDKFFQKTLKTIKAQFYAAISKRR
jgi:TetR/AcrR family transcriptional repressor of nem operon